MAAAVLGSAPPPAVGGTISTAPWGGFTIIIGGGNPPPIYTGSGNTGGDISPATQTKQVGESATFSATGSAPYQWYKDDVAIRGATSSKLQIPKVEAKHAGKYRVSSLFSGGPAATLTVPDQDSTLWSGLVSNWRLTGDGVDDGPFANPLELTDAAPAEDRWGEPGKSIFFNGATTSLVSSFDGGISGRWPRTISFWCRQDYTTAPSRIPLISYGAPNQTFAVWADLSNMSYGFTGITSTRAAALANTLTPNVWQHVVLTVEGDDNGNLVRLYLNGVEQEPQNAFRQAFLTATNGKVHLGADAGGDASAPRFTGWIDDVRLYARVLTAAEIAALHASDTAVPPVIEQQPTPTTVVDPGKPFTLTVTASGTDLTYQWRRGATDIPGATAATYQTDAGPDTAKYTVLVRNAAGAVRSAAAQVYVNQPPSFYVEGPSYVYHGDQVDLRVFAVGTPPLSYQWQRDGVDLPGATATTLSFRATTETSGTYTVRVSNHLSAPVSRPQPIFPRSPAVITAMPANVEVALGGEAEFSVTAISNSPLTYQWRHNNKEMRGETASVLRLSNVQLSSAGAYSVIVKNEGGRVLSDAATLTVAQARPAALSAWAITQQPQSQSLVYGNGATFSVRLNDTIDVTYQWYKDGALLRGKTYPDLEVVPATPADAGVYKVVIKKGGATLVSNEAALRVENNGVAVYKLSITGRSITGAESRNEAYSGLLVLNTTKQEAGIIWLGQEGPTKTFSSEMRPGMKIRSSAPGIKGTTIVSEVVTESGEWVVWLTGANRVVKMYDEAAFVLPPTLKGTFNSTEPADLGDLTVKSLTATAILDLPTTLKFGYRAQSVRSILYQLETEFRWKEYVEKQPLAP